MRHAFLALVLLFLCNALSAQTLRSTLLLKNLTSLSHQDTLNLMPLADKLKKATLYSIKLSYYKADAKESYGAYKGHKAEMQAVNLIKEYLITRGYDPKKIKVHKATKADYAMAKKAGIQLSGGIRVDIAISGYVEPPIKGR